jgi:Xaa-Pro aminopeptidase
MTDKDRIARIRKALADAKLDALVCSLPKNVLLLSGYWPVVGTSVAIAFDDGSIQLIVPADEQELAEQGWADHVRTFKPAPLDQLTSASEQLLEPLRSMGKKLDDNEIGIEHGEDTEPSTYAAMHLYQDSLRDALAKAFPKAKLKSADGTLRRLRSVKTEGEIERIRNACALTREAFEQGTKNLRPGTTELEAAEAFRSTFKTAQAGASDVHRTEAFFWAMSGKNSALAHGAYARSRPKKMEPGDLVLVHCNTCADGYWTDITRTFSLGHPDDKRNKMYAAVFAAREAALQAIAPGRRGSEIDGAARRVLQDLGFGKEFKHSTGHGIGFGAISPDALPRLHPKSEDVVESGSVFNVEPAIYVEGYGGIRHCDMVCVTENRYELLSDFLTNPKELFLPAGAKAAT